ncbi:hypothetical protein [Agromyces sp. NPDC057865]|uniref:hypothetical protein n=1 Tax=Agromyces sp. NPDC057865 TaxID=3346267 RepID=UPI00367025CA
MSAAPPSSTPPAPPAPASRAARVPATPTGDVDSMPVTVVPQRPPAVTGWLDTLGTVSLVVGICAALLTMVTPFRDPIATGGLAALAVLALVLGIVVRVRAVRAGQRATNAFIGIILSVVALALLAISFIPYLFMSVLAERFDEPPAAPPAVVRPVDDELRQLEASARSAEQMMGVAQQTTGMYPTTLAVTTDGDRLMTPDGLVIAGLPDGTEVNYETSIDGTRYDLVLFGQYGGRVALNSEQGIVSSTPGPTEG